MSERASRFGVDPYSKICISVGVVALVIQMILSGIAFGVAVDVYLRINANYPEILQTSKQVSEIVEGVNAEYRRLDKSAIHTIVKNARNVTHTTNMLVQEHGVDIVNDAHRVSKRAAANSVMFDTVGSAIQLIEDPVREIHHLVTHNNSMNLKKALAQADRVMKKVDAIQLNHVLRVISTFLTKLNDGLSPGTLKELKFIATQFHQFSSDENKKTMQSIVHDTDESMQNLNRIIDLFSHVKDKKPV